MNKYFLFLILSLSSYQISAQEGPNVVLIYVDDLGYNDLSVYGNQVVQTPNADWLAHNGLRFTNAHCTSSTCTPSRFAILTGRYPWRQKGTQILPGDANLIIPKDINTLPKVFQKAGYRTGVVGKWHLGMGKENPVNWNEKINPGTHSVGFDYSFIFAATADRTPNIFLENDRTVGLNPNDPINVSYINPFKGELIAKEHPELLKLKSSQNQGHDQHINNGIGRIGYMAGGKMAEWNDEELGATFTQKSLAFIDTSVQALKPFFLYFAIHDIHVPRMPATQYKGKSKLGLRGDALLEMDAMIGALIQKLKAVNQLDNTMIILSSDNGPVLNDGYEDESVSTAKAENFNPNGIYRGGKYAILEAGTRVPFIVYWPKNVKANTCSDALFSQVNLMGSFEQLLGQKVMEKSDSDGQLDILLGKKTENTSYILEDGLGNSLAILQKGWKYLKPNRGPSFMQTVQIETGFSAEDQLYDLIKDPKEQHNLAKAQPKKLLELKKQMQEAIQKEVKL